MSNLFQQPIIDDQLQTIISKMVTDGSAGLDINLLKNSTEQQDGRKTQEETFSTSNHNVNTSTFVPI